MPTGAIEPSQVDRLMEVGEWLRPMGDTIYGTRGSPSGQDPGARECRGRQVFVHVLDVQAEDVLPPPMEAWILSAALRDGTGVAFAGRLRSGSRLRQAAIRWTHRHLEPRSPGPEAEVGLASDPRPRQARGSLNVFSGMAEFGPISASMTTPRPAGHGRRYLGSDRGGPGRTEIAKAYV